MCHHDSIVVEALLVWEVISQFPAHYKWILWLKLCPVSIMLFLWRYPLYMCLLNDIPVWQYYKGSCEPLPQASTIMICPQILKAMFNPNNVSSIFSKFFSIFKFVISVLPQVSSQLPPFQDRFTDPFIRQHSKSRKMFQRIRRVKFTGSGCDLGEHADSWIKEAQGPLRIWLYQYNRLRPNRGGEKEKKVEEVNLK